MPARISGALVNDLPAIDPVLQHLIERAARERVAAIRASVRRRSALADNPLSVEPDLQLAHRSESEVSQEDPPNRCGLNLVDDELSVLHVVAKRRLAAHPQALLLRSGDLVADAFARDLAFELGERQQHVERQPPTDQTRRADLKVNANAMRRCRRG